MNAVIGLTGYSGVGKGSFYDSIRDYNIPRIITGDITREEVKKRGYALNAKNLAVVANSIAKKYGSYMNFIKKNVQDILVKHDLLVIDCLKQWSDYPALLNYCSNVILVAIDAGMINRYERMNERRRGGDPASLKAFLKLDENETLRGVGELVSLSDCVISNNGTKEDLRNKSVKFLESIICSF